MASTKYCDGWYSAWWYHEWRVENITISYNLILAGSLETWYYFRLYFSCSCSGYELTLIKRSHTLNCYSFLQKFLMKTKTYKLVVGNCGSSIYCQQIQKKPSPFCYFMSCPINKVSFWQFQVEKNVFAAGNGGRGGGEVDLAPACSPFPYGPVYYEHDEETLDSFILPSYLRNKKGPDLNLLPPPLSLLFAATPLIQAFTLCWKLAHSIFNNYWLRFSFWICYISLVKYYWNSWLK